MKFGGFNLPKELLLSTDVMNTINGGMSQPQIRVEKIDEGYRVNTKITGVAPENMQVDIKNNKLFIFHHIHVDNEDLYNEIKTIPYMVGFFNIPFDVDIKGINASYEDNHLKINMPFNEMADGYHKTIDIKRG